MIAYDAVGNGSGVTNKTSISWSHTCSSGDNRLLLVFIRTGSDQGDTTTGATYNGVAMTKMSKTPNCGGVSRSTLIGFYLLNPASGAHTVTVNFTSTTYVEGASISYTGVAQIGFPDSINEKIETNVSSFSVSTTTIKSKCWTTLATIDDSSRNAGAGSYERVTQNGIVIFDSNADITTPSSTTMATTGNTKDLAGIIVSFAPQQASGGAFLLNFM
jgi:hypothetical protein